MEPWIGEELDGILFLPNTLHYLLKKKNRIVEEEKGRCFYSIQLQSYYGMIEV